MTLASVSDLAGGSPPLLVSSLAAAPPGVVAAAPGQTGRGAGQVHPAAALHPRVPQQQGPPPVPTDRAHHREDQT